MLAALFISALIWNVGTWWFGIPNSSSHALIGALIGVALANSIKHARGFGHGVDWSQVWSVLSALLFSPIIGFVLAFIVFRLLKLAVHDKRLYEPPEGEKPPVWWMRGLLILTCTGVSFAHGTNDGQKSIGLIMLVIIGLFPTSFAVNLDSKGEDIAEIAKKMPVAAVLIERYGDDQKAIGAAAARKLASTFAAVKSPADIPEAERPAVRNDLDQALSELKTASEAKGISKEDKESAKSIHDLTMKSVQYAPWWVRILSALCLGFGTMVGYRRIVTIRTLQRSSRRWWRRWRRCTCRRLTRKVKTITEELCGHAFSASAVSAINNAWTKVSTPSPDAPSPSPSPTSSSRPL